MKVNRFTRFLGKRKRRTFKNIFPWCMVLSLILSAVLANYSVKKDTNFKEDMLVDYIKDERSHWMELLNHDDYDYSDIVRVLRDYGEEKYATSIARNIIKYRETKPIETTLELVEIIRKSMPARELRDGHPARKTFQAIRIEVNHELDVLESALIQALELVNVGGRVCVITFHSLEDRIVKNIFKKYSEIDSKFAKLPYVPDEYLPKYKVICKGLTPTDEELTLNNRARSARLRVIERIKD